MNSTAKCVLKKETLPSLKRKNFIRKGFDDVMEDIMLRSAGVAFLQVEAKEVREEQYFISLVELLSAMTGSRQPGGRIERWMDDGQTDGGRWGDGGKG